MTDILNRSISEISLIVRRPISLSLGLSLRIMDSGHGLYRLKVAVAYSRHKTRTGFRPLVFYLKPSIIFHTPHNYMIHFWSCDLKQDTSIKLAWIKDIAGELDPEDPTLISHLSSIAIAVLANLQNTPFQGKDIKVARTAAAVLDSTVRSYGIQTQ